MFAARNELEIADDVVVDNLVSVMDDLIGCEWSPEVLSHHEAVLGDVAVPIGHAAKPMGDGNKHEHVAVTVDYPAPFPAGVGLARSG